MSTLINRLREFARYVHSDFGVAGEAADEIERLERVLYAARREEQEHYSMLDDTLIERQDRLRKARREERERCVKKIWIETTHTIHRDFGTSLIATIRALEDEK